jgi:hypothetical protein
VRVDYRRYRLLQIIHAYKNYYLDRRLTAGEFGEVARLMQPAERVLYGVPMRAVFSGLRLIPTRMQQWIATRLRVAIGQYSGLGAIRHQNAFRSVLDVFEAVDPLADDGAERAA